MYLNKIFESNIKKKKMLKYLYPEMGVYNTVGQISDVRPTDYRQIIWRMDGSSNQIFVLNFRLCFLKKKNLEYFF